ncbi:hypothetical protein [Enterovibrio baiacu]|uniref:hypothetical protein n=1 Tax=Enterovibrio baiacu TaxID=2491023 RepID=UPI001012838E|nr:hypothetical protein [Enterovibrio baiacu]MBE1273558.1 hypothetical protein [Enterovibrio baiacu]
MKLPNEKHSLLVQPFDRSASASLAISDIMLRFVNAVSEKIRAYRIRQARNRFYRDISDYPAYILEDIGLNPEEVAIAKAHQEKLGVDTVAEIERR